MPQIERVVPGGRVHLRLQGGDLRRCAGVAGADAGLAGEAAPGGRAVAGPPRSGRSNATIFCQVRPPRPRLKPAPLAFAWAAISSPAIPTFRNAISAPSLVWLSECPVRPVQRHAATVPRYHTENGSSGHLRGHIRAEPLSHADGLLSGAGCATLAKDRFEVVVIDNCSTEDLQPSIEQARDSLGLQIRSARTGEDRGPAPARNLGVQMAQAGIIAFTDSDCRPTPMWLELGLAAMEGPVWAWSAGRCCQSRSRLRASPRNSVS